VWKKTQRQFAKHLTISIYSDYTIYRFWNLNRRLLSSRCTFASYFLFSLFSKDLLQGKSLFECRQKYSGHTKLNRSLWNCAKDWLAFVGIKRHKKKNERTSNVERELSEFIINKSEVSYDICKRLQQNYSLFTSAWGKNWKALTKGMSQKSAPRTSLVVRRVILLILSNE
jgi:hypothetical protein